MSRPGQRPFGLDGVALAISIDKLPHPVVRQIHIAPHVSLAMFHRVLQAAFGWTESHLYSFEIGDASFSEGDAEDLWFADAHAAPIGAVCVTGHSFEYVYDFGDDWRHTVTTTEILHVPDDVVFRCVGGAGAAPPEDCGGPPGFENLLDALADQGHPDHSELKRWAPRGYDPHRFDLAAIEKKLARLRREQIRMKRRRA